MSTLRIYRDPVNLPPGLPFAPGDGITKIVSANDIYQSVGHQVPAALAAIATRLNCPGCYTLRPFDGLIHLYHEPGFTPGVAHEEPDEAFDFFHDFNALKRRYHGRDFVASLEAARKLMEIQQAAFDLSSQEELEDRPVWFDYHATFMATCQCGATAARHITRSDAGDWWEYSHVHPEERTEPALGVRWWHFQFPHNPRIQIEIPTQAAKGPLAPITLIGPTAVDEPSARRAVLTLQHRLAHTICPSCGARAPWNSGHFRPFYSVCGDQISVDASCVWGTSPNHGPHGDRFDRYPGSYRCRGAGVHIAATLADREMEIGEPEYWAT